MSVQYWLWPALALAGLALVAALHHAQLRSLRLAVHVDKGNCNAHTSMHRRALGQISHAHSLASLLLQLWWRVWLWLPAAVLRRLWLGAAVVDLCCGCSRRLEGAVLSYTRGTPFWKIKPRTDRVYLERLEAISRQHGGTIDYSVFEVKEEVAPAPTSTLQRIGFWLLGTKVAA
jgi:hypothetical protein